MNMKKKYLSPMFNLVPMSTIGPNAGVSPNPLPEPTRKDGELSQEEYDRSVIWK